MTISDIDNHDIDNDDIVNDDIDNDYNNTAFLSSFYSCDIILNCQRYQPHCIFLSLRYKHKIRNSIICTMKKDPRNVLLFECVLESYRRIDMILVLYVTHDTDSKITTPILISILIPDCHRKNRYVQIFYHSRINRATSLKLSGPVYHPMELMYFIQICVTYPY